MGTPIPRLITPDPVAAGDDCTTCWGAGKTFGDIDTPESISITLSGINKTDLWVEGNPEPPNGEHLLDQTVEPCYYFFISGEFGFQVQFQSDDTFVQVEAFGIGDVFIGFAGDICQTTVMNEVDTKYTGGSCVITIPEVKP